MAPSREAQLPRCGVVARGIRGEPLGETHRVQLHLPEVEVLKELKGRRKKTLEGHQRDGACSWPTALSQELALSKASPRRLVLPLNQSVLWVIFLTKDCT